MKLGGPCLCFLALVQACAISDDDDRAWEHFRDQATRVVDGRTIYVVEWDLPLSLERLREYFDAHVANDGLGTTQQQSVVASNPNGTDNIWNATERHHLTYCVSDEFGADKARAVAEMDSATHAWEAEAHVNFEYVPSQDPICNQFNVNVRFAVRPWTNPGACAFLPSGNDACTPRTLHMNFFHFDNDPTRHQQAPAMTTVGVFRHELGHILGLRHEQVIAPNGGGCPLEPTPFRPLTTYDRASVMHYPQCSGFLGSDFSISDLDAVGVKALYGPSLTPTDLRLRVGHVDLDGRADLLQLWRGWGSIPTCKYNGTSFDCTNPAATLFNPGDPQQQWLTGDFNGDQRTDVVQAYRKFGSYPTCVADGIGGWQCSNPAATQIVTHPDDNSEQQFLVGKWDADNRDDIIQVYRKTPSISLCTPLVDKTKTVTNWQCASSPATIYDSGSAEQQFLVGEVDSPYNARSADLIQTYRGWGSIPVCRSVPGGTWDCTNFAATIYNSGSHEQRFATADVNGDGRTDVLQFYRGWGSIPMCTAAKNVFGDFAGWTCTNAPALVVNSGSSEQQFLTGDFNGDGKTDVVQTWRGWTSLPFCGSTGSGWHCGNKPATIIDSGSREQRFVAADVDGDGKTDIIQTHPLWSHYPVCFARVANAAMPMEVTWDCQKIPATIYKIAANTNFDAANKLVDFAAYNFVGITALGIKDGQVAWSRSAGMANDTDPASIHIPWHLGSVSKLFIATAAMRLMDMGLLNPNASAGLANTIPNQNLAQPTLAEFANHTAGVQRDPCTSYPIGDPVKNLGSVMSTCLANGVWLDRAPGAAYGYSNFGAAWIARRVEVLSGTDFNAFTRTQIFAPLGMSSTGWFLSDFVGRPIEIGYYGFGVPETMNSFSPYAAGNLRASAMDLARFMMMWANKGNLGGTQFLMPTTVEFALTRPKPNVSRAGFLWHREITESGRVVWGHGGYLTGSPSCTQLSIDPATREGVLIMVNGGCPAHMFPSIEDRVYRALQTL